MNFIYLLIVSYGITFGLQHKIPTKLLSLIQEKIKWVSSLLACSYCTGFHAGWMTWLLFAIAQADLLDQTIKFGMFIDMTLFAFASAGFSYLMDVLTQWLELSVQSELPEADEE